VCTSDNFVMAADEQELMGGSEAALEARMISDGLDNELLTRTSIMERRSAAAAGSLLATE